MTIPREGGASAKRPLPGAWGESRESFPLRRRPRLLSGKLSGPIFMLAASLWVSGVLNTHAQTEAPSEYEVKAVFLYNFARFVEWPPGALVNGHAPLVLGILGKDPFGNALGRLVKDKMINGHELVVRRFKPGQNARGCQVLFISSSEENHLRSILEDLRGSSVLTVGESDGFPQLGGIINFNLENNKVRFEINVDAAARAHLKISSKLLSLAKIVRDENRGG